MNANFFQIIALCILIMVTFYDVGNGNRWFGGTKCVLSGWITGILFGDPVLGLKIGASMQLMSLGLLPMGGAAVPDYIFGTIVGAAVAIKTGRGIEYGIAFALPAGMLIMQLTIFQNILAIWFVHQAEKCIDREKFLAMRLWTFFGITPRMLKGLIPLILCLTNVKLIDSVMNMLPQWLMTGMSVAGGLLPACGIAILLRYMDVKKFWPYCIVGFVLCAYLGLGMMGVALIGLALGAITYFNHSKQQNFLVGGTDDEL